MFIKPVPSYAMCVNALSQFELMVQELSGIRANLLLSGSNFQVQHDWLDLKIGQLSVDHDELLRFLCALRQGLDQEPLDKYFRYYSDIDAETGE